MPDPSPALALPLVHENVAPSNVRPRVLRASVSAIIGFCVGMVVMTQVKSSLVKTDPTNLWAATASSPYSQMSSNFGLLTPKTSLRAPSGREQLLTEAKHYVRKWRPKKPIELKRLHAQPTPDPFSPRPPEIIIIEQAPIPDTPIEYGTGRFAKLVPKKTPGQRAPWKERYDPTPQWDPVPDITYGPGHGAFVGLPGRGGVDVPKWEGVQPEIVRQTKWTQNEKAPAPAPAAEEPVAAEPDSSTEAEA